jgi:hypothetical protein
MPSPVSRTAITAVWAGTAQLQRHGSPAGVNFTALVKFATICWSLTESPRTGAGSGARSVATRTRLTPLVPHFPARLADGTHELVSGPLVAGLDTVGYDYATLV